MAQPTGEVSSPPTPRSAEPPGPPAPEVPAAPAPITRQRVWDPAILAAVALGGILGAEGRYGLGLMLPHHPGQLPASTWIVNTSGCFLIGVLMVVVAALTAPHRLIRPFLGTGVLGGYTTFSTATLDVQQLMQHGRPALALGYLLGTLGAALIAVAIGTAGTRAADAAWTRR